MHNSAGANTCECRFSLRQVVQGGKGNNYSADSKLRLPAEWEKQSAVMLALPHEKTDWAPILKEVRENYARIIAAITRFEKVLLLCPDLASGRSFLRDHNLSSARIVLRAVDYNDTWTRDYGPLSLEGWKGPVLADFMFNGWGLKFAADRDNLVTQELFHTEVFAKHVNLITAPIVFEGGSVESDGQGTVLVTSRCLLSPNRNPYLTKKEIEEVLRDTIGAMRVLWLENGELEGDDTDAHIDTLARLAPDDTIIYMSAPRTDSHYDSLKKMEKNLSQFKTARGSSYKLVRLPFPKAVNDREGNRLPATYANYLVINGAVLVPTYGDIENDEKALASIASVYAGREIIGINCRTLVEQHGSLHCVTMQLIEGVI